MFSLKLFILVIDLYFRVVIQQLNLPLSKVFLKKKNIFEVTENEFLSFRMVKIIYFYLNALDSHNLTTLKKKSNSKMVYETPFIWYVITFGQCVYPKFASFILSYETLRLQNNMLIIIYNGKIGIHLHTLH